MTQTIDDILSAEEVCARIKISPRLLRDWTRLRLIPSHRLGHRTVRYRASDIDAFIERKRRDAFGEGA